MKELTFTVMREMSGDKDYVTGDTRELPAVDAVELYLSGALKPKGKEAQDAMDELTKDVPRERGIVHEPPRSDRKEDAPMNKDAGDAPKNKRQRGESPTPTPTPSPTPTPTPSPTPTPTPTPSPTPSSTPSPTPTPGASGKRR